MPPPGQAKSAEQRDRFVALMAERSPEEFRILFSRTKTNMVNKMHSWGLIVDELNSLPGARYDIGTWRNVWVGMLYSVRERCQQFNDPNVSLNTMTPLLLWERGLMSLYDLTVPESIMNWTGHVDHSDSDSSSVDESDTEPEAEPPPATTASLATVQLPNSQSQDAVLLHCFTAFPQMCPPRGYDDRWNRFVDILNVLGPRGTSIEWKTRINAAKSAVAAATERDANWSTFEEGVARTLRPSDFGALVNAYPIRHKHPMLHGQVEVLLYYLEHHPNMWSPDIYTEDSLWPELSGLLNVLGPTSSVDEHKQIMVNTRKSIRLKTPLQMTAVERQLDNLYQRTAVRMPRSTQKAHVYKMYQFCGQLSVRLSATETTAKTTTDSKGGALALIYKCMRCRPPTQWSDSQSFDQHQGIVHNGIESVFVKVEPADVTTVDRQPPADVGPVSMYIRSSMSRKRTHPKLQIPEADGNSHISSVEPTSVLDDDGDAVQPVADHDRITDDVDAAEAINPAADALLQCDICKQTFQGMRLLRMHMYQHVREATFVPCGVCDLLLRTPLEWQRHRDRHNVDTDTRCDECDMRFAHAQHRGHHFKRAHMQPMDGRLANAWTLVEPTSTTADGQQALGEWECDQRPCRQSFNRRTELRDHLLGVHGCAELRYDRQTDRVVDLLHGYTRRASLRKMFRCNLCGLQTPVLNIMQKHLLLHGDQKPYMCSRCPQTFRKLYELARHRRDQHGGAAKAGCVCETCGRKFVEKWHLQKHRRIHTGERPFRCSAENCPEAFRRSTERRKHYLAEHYEGRLGYPCRYCGKEFRLLSERTDHMRERHTEERRAPKSVKADPDGRKGSGSDE